MASTLTGSRSPTMHSTINSMILKQYATAIKRKHVRSVVLATLRLAITVSQMSSSEIESNFAVFRPSHRRLSATFLQLRSNITQRCGRLKSCQRKARISCGDAACESNIHSFWWIINLSILFYSQRLGVPVSNAHICLCFNLFNGLFFCCCLFTDKSHLANTAEHDEWRDKIQQRCEEIRSPHASSAVDWSCKAINDFVTN